MSDHRPRWQFEAEFAAVHDSTPQRLADLGWYSGKRDGEWRAVCAAPDLPEDKRLKITDELVNAAPFGATPPVNGKDKP